MARLVKKDATGPMEIKVGDNAVHICMCGLSDNQPYCTGKHALCRGEDAGKLYIYENGKRREVKAP